MAETPHLLLFFYFFFFFFFFVQFDWATTDFLSISPIQHRQLQKMGFFFFLLLRKHDAHSLEQNHFPLRFCRQLLYHW